MDIEQQLTAVRAAAALHEGLHLLVLYGSRGRGRDHARSDWDFGYQGDERLDSGALHAALAFLLESDRLDLVDLDRASALLRFEAARYGRCVYERAAGTHEDFVLAATLFWCDAEAVIRRAQRAVLAGLPAP